MRTPPRPCSVTSARALALVVIALASVLPARAHALPPSVSVHHARFRFDTKRGFTLGLEYSIARGRKVNREYAVAFPEIVTDPRRNLPLTESTACDRGGCPDVMLREAVLAVDHVAQEVGSIHIQERMDSLEVTAGVILPDPVAQPNDLEVYRLHWQQDRILPPVEKETGMLNARLTIF